MMELTDEQLDFVIGGAPDGVFQVWKSRLINKQLSLGIKNDRVSNPILDDRSKYRVDIQRNTNNYIGEGS